MSGFINNHPGGAYLVKNAIGDDLGKYLNGSTIVDNRHNSYMHSEIARNYMSRLTVGYLCFSSELFVSKIEIPLNYEMKWVLINKYQIADGVFCLEFKSNEFEVRGNPRGFE